MTYTPLNFGFWKAYLIHMRPYLLFVSGIAGLSGMALVSNLEILSGASLLQFSAFFLAYGFGQALTDCFQVDTDRLSSPYRPLSQGILRPKEVAIVSVLGLVLCSGILIYFNVWNIVFGLLSIFGLATYSIVKKRYWFGGPFHNAWIVALLPIMGFLVSTKVGFNGLNNPVLWYVVLLNFFAYANFVLMGYLKDIEADRQTGYQTFPVVFGWNASVWVADVFVVLSIVLCSIIVAGNLYAIIFMLVASVMALLGQGYAHFTKDKTEENASFPIVMTVRSFIIWNLAVILAFNKHLLLFALVCYLLFEIVLALRPMRSQI